MHFIKYLKEDADGRELVQSKLKFDKNELDPVMSEATLNYHFDGLAAKYFERYNKGEGDSKFNYGGAVLHNLFFAGLTPARAANKPSGDSAELIDAVYGSFDKFKEAVEKEIIGYRNTLQLINNLTYLDKVIPQKTLEYYKIYKKQFI
jgi:superoxide dismutase